MKTITIPARQFEDYDDCLRAAREKIAREMGLELWQTDAQWEDESRETIIVEVAA